MGKITGSYESVVRGVSEQVAHDRRSGQHAVQDNFISDPVRGLARRHGSQLLDEVSLGLYETAPLIADTLRSKVTRFFVDGIEYDLIYRTGTGEANSFAWCFNRATRKFLPIVTGDDAVMATLTAGGVSAATNVGRYLYIAGNTVIPAQTGTNVFSAVANTSKVAIWCRGGAYSRTFKVIVTKLDGTKVEAEYKTVSSSYPLLLDTSDILTEDEDYQKKVNDRVYAYNSEVTKWIGTAAEDITPENIASKLATSLTAGGILGVNLRDGTVTIDDPSIRDIIGEDGGDGSLLRAVGSELTSAELVSTIHYAGKIVKIRPQRSKGDDAFYLAAFAKDENETGFCDVAWREAAGYIMQPTATFAMGTVVGGVMYIAGSPTALETLSGIDTPDFPASTVGDALTTALPYFFGQRITYLGIFQDRLVIGAGATVFLSRPGDYLNFFRQTSLSIIDTDPWEGYALGAEDDIINSSTLYDRDLLLFGSRFQYSISGRTTLTPKTASIVIASAYEDATEAPPQLAGNLVFYGKYAGEADNRKASLHQVQAGAIVESPESFNVSQQLDGYIVGRPVEIVALAAPNMVVLRTDNRHNVLYTYSYLDSANGTERLMDSWSRWTWAAKLGTVIGVSSLKGSLLVYMLRFNEGTAYVACERFVRDTGVSPLPYADSLRPLPLANDAPFLSPKPASAYVVLAGNTPHHLMGYPYTQVATFTAAYPDDLAYAWVGFDFPTFVTPTNPYMLDRDKRSVLTGRLTLGRTIVSVKDTGGFTLTVTHSGGVSKSLDFSGRILGQSINTIGRQPIVTTSLIAPIGKEIRECAYTITAKTWLPLTITAIEWAGQSFNNARRV